VVAGLETQTDVDELIESLTKSLEDGGWNVRGGVIRRLGEIGDVKAIEPLIKALGAQNKNVRQRAVKALVKIGESAVDLLIEALGGEDKDMRRRAVEALGKIGDPRAIDPLINALRDADRWVRWWAAGMLGAIDDTRVIARTGYLRSRYSDATRIRCGRSIEKHARDAKNPDV